MRALWRRLEAAASRSPLSLRLRPAASDAHVRAAERTMGLAFPEDFRESLLVHDGQEPGEGERDAFEWLPGHERLACLDAIVDEWVDESSTFETQHAGQPPEEILGGQLYHYLWHPKRIPIAGNPWWDQDNTYLDLLPGPRGVHGQVAMFGKGVFGEVHAPSFRVGLELYANALESGEWSFRDGQCLPRSKAVGGWARYASKKLGTLKAR